LPLSCLTHRIHALVCSALVGEIDEEADAELALDEIVAEPLKPVVH